MAHSSTMSQLDRAKKEKVTRFEEFLNERLRGDLKVVIEQMGSVTKEMTQCQDLVTFMDRIHSKQYGDGPLKIQSDLGCNFYVNCTIDEPEKVHVYIGLGFYLEMTPIEAVEVINKRLSLLKGNRKDLQNKIVEINSHIKLVLEKLREIQEIPVK